jgi:hypothetical protein
MTIFQDIADQYAIADAAFAQAEQNAFDSNDDAAFDRASEQRRHNDQAYFLYLFTRFEREVNRAAETLLTVRAGGTWSDRRVWQAWARIEVEDIHFLSKVEVLTDKLNGGISVRQAVLRRAKPSRARRRLGGRVCYFRGRNSNGQYHGALYRRLSTATKLPCITPPATPAGCPGCCRDRPACLRTRSGHGPSRKAWLKSSARW